MASALLLTGCGDASSSSEEPSFRDAGADVLGEANLLTDEDAIYPNGGSDWRATDTRPGDGRAAFSPCAQSGLSGLGAETVFQRDFEFVVTDTDEVEPTLTFNEIAGEFGGDADAEAAYGEIKSWLEDCLPAEADEYNAGDFAPVPLAVDGQAEVQLSTYRPVPDDLDPYGDEGWFLETGLVLAGDRVAVLTQLTHGQDYDWPEGTPVEQMLPVAAERLTDGGPTDAATATPTAEPSEPPAPPTGAAGVVTAIPDDIPLGAGLWDARGDGGEYHPEPSHPDGDEQRVPVDLCGRSVWPVAHGVDRLWAWATGPEYGDLRELVTLPTVDAAVAAVDAFRIGLQDCAGEDNWGWTVSDVDTGYDSVVFSRSYTEGLGLDSFQVTRVGNAVLLTVVSGEGSIGDIDGMDRVRADLTKRLAQHLCVFTEAGC